jgi:hypothetical protein
MVLPLIAAGAATLGTAGYGMKKIDDEKKPIVRRERIAKLRVAENLVILDRVGDVSLIVIRISTP